MKYTAAQLSFRKTDEALGGEPTMKRFCDEAITREKEVFNEMGPYRGRRELAEQWMRNIFEHRVDDDEDNIFRLSNESLGVVRSAIVFVGARTQDDLFGTVPFFAVLPEPRTDPALAETIYEHAAMKLRAAKFEQMGEETVERVFNLGERVLRVGWKTDIRKYERVASVLVLDGKPVLTTEGDYIYAEDQMVEEGVETSNVQRPTSNETNEETQEPAKEEPARMVFAKDPSIAMTPEMSWKEWLIEEEEKAYDGLNLEGIDWRAWRCSPSYKGIEDAPFRGHIYEARLSDLKRKMELYQEAPESEWDEDLRAMFERMRTAGPEAKAEERVSGENRAGMGGDIKNPVLKCMDVEIEWDPKGEGDTRWFFATILIEQQEVFFVDYLCNMLPGGDSLYTVASINNLPNTWVGRGWLEMYEDVMDDTDRLWNTLRHRDNINANPITGCNYNAVEESKEELDSLRPGTRVTLKNGKRIEDFIQAFVLPQADTGTWELLNFLQVNFQLETGVTSAAKGGVGDLPATNTATGIQSVLASGSVLHKHPAKAIRDGLQEFMRKAIVLLYAMQEKDETFTSAGDEPQTLTLTRAEIEGLEMNVKIMMTRFHQRELVANAQAAIGTHKEYLALPEGEKGPARTLYIQLLKGLEIQNAEDVIREPIPPDPNAKPQRDPSERINVNYKDLPPTSKVDLLDEMGISANLEEVKATEEKAEPAPMEAAA